MDKATNKDCNGNFVNNVNETLDCLSIKLCVADVEVDYVHEFDHDQLGEHPTSTGSPPPVRVFHITSTAPTTYTPP